MHQAQKDILKLAKKHNLATLSLREIGSYIGIEHPQKIKHHLEQLEKKGLLHLNKELEQQKLIKPGTKSGNLINFPILGEANCGLASSFADENFEGYLKVSSPLLNNPTIRSKRSVIAIKAVGDSMNMANPPIEDGDFVLVDTQDLEPKNGDYVLSIIDGKANIKKFLKEPNRIILVSESSQNYPPIFITEEDDYLLNGKVVEVMKSPKEETAHGKE